jgi:hypothetical protein
MPADETAVRETGSQVWQTVFHGLDYDYSTVFAGAVADAVAKATEGIIRDYMENPPPKAGVATMADGFRALWPNTDDGFYEARAFGEKHCPAWPGWRVESVETDHGPRWAVRLCGDMQGNVWWAESPQASDDLYAIRLEEATAAGHYAE